MTDQPKKTLKIIRKVAPATVTPTEPTKPIELSPKPMEVQAKPMEAKALPRTGKRVLTKDTLQAVKPEKGTDFYRAKKLPKPKPTPTTEKATPTGAKPTNQNALKKPAKLKPKPPKKNTLSHLVTYAPKS